MPVRVLGPDGSGTNETVTAGLVYAAQKGAKVVNVSFAGPGYSTAMEGAIDEPPQTLFVVAAGNGEPTVSGTTSSSRPSIPATTGDLEQPHLRRGDDSYGRARDFSNYGIHHIPLAAPGHRILSTRAAATPCSATASRPRPAGRPAAAAVVGADDRGRCAGSWSATDSPGASYVDDDRELVPDAGAARPEPAHGCTLAYRMRLEAEFSFDHFFVDASTDGSNWDRSPGSRARRWGTGSPSRRSCRSRAPRPPAPVRPLERRVGHVRTASTSTASRSTATGPAPPRTRYTSIHGTSLASAHVAGGRRVRAGEEPVAPVGVVLRRDRARRRLRSGARARRTAHCV